MATRHVFLLALGFGFASSALVPPAAFAVEDDVAVPEVQNAKFQFIGRITGTTFVRSGPSNNFYATAKLDKGTEVTVVGIKYKWLKIVPPEGSFSLVPQVYVDRRGEGKVARVNSSLNVRAGSSENAMKSTIQTKLMPGQDVTILGVQDEYYKIEPPEGAYVFVDQQFVEVVRRNQPVGQIAQGQEEASGEERAELAQAPEEPATDGPADTDLAPETANRMQLEAEPAPGTQPAGAIANANASAAKPVPAAVAEDFRKLEAEFDAASGGSVMDQPIDELTEGYTTLVQGGELRGSMKRIADARLRALQMRADAREQLREFRKSREQMDRRQDELKVERQEIDERIAQTKVSTFTAVGTLRISSLQQGNTLLYRLTDPSTNRTVAYVRSNDAKYAGLMNQFVGVRGELTNDPRLKMKIITSSDAEVVDPSKVNSTVIATIIPPSMITIAGVDQGDASN